MKKSFPLQVKYVLSTLTIVPYCFHSRAGKIVCLKLLRRHQLECPTVAIAELFCAVIGQHEFALVGELRRFNTIKYLAEKRRVVGAVKETNGAETERWSEREK